MRPGAGWTRVAVLGLGAGLVVSCGILDPGKGDAWHALDEARARWEATGWTDYTVIVARSCFCPPGTLGPFRLTVEGGEIAAVERVDGEPGDPGDAEGLRDVDGLFEAIETALREGAHRVSVTYDPVVGSPRSLFIDREEEAVDEEMGWEVERPVPREEEPGP